MCLKSGAFQGIIHPRGSSYDGLWVAMRDWKEEEELGGAGGYVVESPKMSGVRLGGRACTGKHTATCTRTYVPPILTNVARNL